MAFALIAVMAAFYEFVLSKWTNYHAFDGKCLTCHLTTPVDAGTSGTFVKDITVMCTSCHRDARELSHPVDVLPKDPVPVNLPLDWKGEITCVTCHTAHQPGHGGHHLRVSAKGPGLCNMCHGNVEEKMHKTFGATAHLKSESIGRTAPDSTGVELDELSIQCLSCHDSMLAREALVESREVVLGYHENNLIGVSHPIGVSYSEARRKYGNAYKDIKTLPKELRLFDGNIGCGTCHNPYSKRHFELAMSNEVSALCLACHDK